MIYITTKFKVACALVVLGLLSFAPTAFAQPIMIGLTIKVDNAIKGIDSITVTDGNNQPVSISITDANNQILHNFDMGNTGAGGVAKITDPTGGSAGLWRGANGTNVLTITVGGRSIQGVFRDGNYTLRQAPEPSTLILLGTGLAGLGWFGRKRLFKKL